MRHLHFIILFILVSTSPIITQLQAQFKIETQLRNRVEVRDGYQELLPDAIIPNLFVSQRTRLSFIYETDNLKLRITPQDVRIWGDEQLATTTGVFGDQASLDLFEAYFDIKTSNWLWLTIGRQPFAYDNERLLSVRNWNQSGLTYDAILAKIKLQQWNLHVAGSWNTQVEALSNNIYSSNRIKSLDFAWLNRKFNDQFNLSFLHISTGITQTDTTNTLTFKQTTGIYTEYTGTDLKIWADAYYQYGKNTKDTKVSALLFDFDINYKINNLKPGIGLSYLSGNSNVGSGQTQDNLFDVLYGARHKYFGYMDYYRNFATNTKQGGLIDYFFYLDYKVSKSINLRNISHYFELAQTNTTTPTDKNLGFENDLVLKYNFNSWGTIESGYCFYLPTESLKTIQNKPNTNFAQYFYLQITITPTLFKQPESIQ